MRNKILLSIVASFVSVSVFATPDVKSCFGCHGQNGQGKPFSKIAGKTKEDLDAKLKGYRSKTIVNPMMNKVAANLTDQDINDLAQYFSTVPAADLE